MRILIFLLLFCLTYNAHAESRSLINLNGKDYPVFFNDGDSFRVLAGDLSGSKARLGGFNTLESYGPVHSWGTWTTKELYVIAKMGTYNAREGVWSCTSDLAKDTYGRTLWRCPKLSVDQIRKGFAHAMTITKESAHPDDVAAQKEARQNKSGMWAHGIPEYVLTSIHSVNERSGDRPAYNRLVSSIDGHSLKWKHRDAYNECQNVCWEPTRVDQDQRFTDRWTARLADISKKYSAEELTQVTHYFLKHKKALTDLTITWKDQADRDRIEKALLQMLEEGWVDAALSAVKTCMIYVDFRRRFGTSRAVCLK
jgi:endonuclease YncB( thermonuclease family)